MKKGRARWHLAFGLFVASGLGAWCAAFYVIKVPERINRSEIIRGDSSAPTSAESFRQMMADSMAQMTIDAERMPMSGNPDQDFAALMIVHHQGAIAMAKAQFLGGKNPVLRRLAQEIVVTQAAEIEVLQRELTTDASRCR